MRELTKSIVLAFVFLLLFIVGTMFLTKHFQTSDDMKKTALSYQMESFTSELVNNIEIDYHDLDLTKEELAVVEKYQTESLTMAITPYPYYYDKVAVQHDNKTSYYTLGLTDYIYESIKEIYDINLIKKEMPFYESLEALKQGDVDMIANLLRSEEREDYYDFTKAFIPFNGYLYTKDENLTSIEDIKGLHIGILESVVFFTDEVNDDYHLSYTEYPSEEGLIKALENDEIDAICCGISKNLLVKGFQKNDINHLLPIHATAIAYQSFNNPDIDILMAAIEKSAPYLFTDLDFDEEYIKVNYKNGSFFTAEERAFIASTKLSPIQLQSMMNATVYSRYEDGELVGLLPKLFDYYSDFIGWEYVLTAGDKPYKELYQDIYVEQTGNIDGLIPTWHRTCCMNDVLFSIPVMEDECLIVGRSNMPIFSNLNDVSEAKIAVAPGYSYNQYIKRTIPNNHVVWYDTMDDMINAYKKGEIDYFFINGNFPYKHIQFTEKLYDLELKYKTGYMVTIHYGFTQSERGAMIATILDKTSHFLSADTLITSYLDDVSMSSVIDNFKLQIWITFAIIVICFVLLLLAVALMSRHKSKQDAKMDMLTGAYNRKALFQYFNTLKNKPFLIAYIDLDKFKEINDVYGHAAGDRVLTELATRLLSIKDISTYRIGGDEFVLITANLDLDLDTILNEIFAQDIFFNNVLLDVNVSAGLLRSDEYHTENFSELLSLADFAMYCSKRDQNCRVFHLNQCNMDDFSLQSKMNALLDESNLSEVPIQSCGIYNHYQPIIDNKTGEIIAIESLARMTLHENTYLPEQFIPLFERLDRIDELDLYVMEEGLRFFETLVKEDPSNATLAIAFNLSPMSISKLSVKDILAVIVKYQVSPNHIIIDIPESTKLTDKNRTLLSELIKHGIKIAVHDLSIEQSSICKLMKFDIDIVKIDQKLAEKFAELLEDGENIEDSKFYKALYSLVSMLSEMDCMVVMKGVETSATFDITKKLNIAFTQGYYFYQPMPPNEVQDCLS